MTEKKREAADRKAEEGKEGREGLGVWVTVQVNNARVFTQLHPSKPSAGDAPLPPWFTPPPGLLRQS